MKGSADISPRLIPEAYPMLRWMAKASGARIREDLQIYYALGCLDVDEGREWAEACGYPFAMAFLEKPPRPWWMERVARSLRRWVR